MTVQKPSLAKGVRDFGPAVMKKRKFIMNTIEQCFVQYGFEAIETPAVEKLSTLTDKYGEEGDQLLFKILNNGDFLNAATQEIYDSKDSKKLSKVITEKGLRYDLTVPLARYVSMNRSHITFPFKRYQIQPVWRADRPQRGRYREFWQCDADIVGSTSTYVDIELLDLYNDVFLNLKLPVIIRFNNRKIFDCILQDNLKDEDSFRFMQLIDKYDKIGDKVNDLLLTDINQKAVDIWTKLLEANAKKTNTEKLQALSLIFPTIPEELLEELKGDLDLVQSKGKNAISLDFTLARGLSYYTGIIYEVVPQAELLPEGFSVGSIGGGGRYDKLTEMFGFDGGQGVGISFGLDRIYDVMEAADLFQNDIEDDRNILFCVMDKENMPMGYRLCKSLREEGLRAELYPKALKLRKQLDYANAKKIRFAAIIGQNEILNKTVMMKDLESGEQKQMDWSEIKTFIQAV
jgi:histidyl-tRNA synthetase